MFEHWGSIEADFQREYNMDLVVWIHKLSWRKFIILLRGLSPNSIWFNLVKQAQSSTKVIEDPKVAERAVDRVWG